MAKNNPGEILTCDWNPVIGCERYSASCRNCWFLEGIFPWHKRLGIIPDDARSDRPTLFENRMSVENLRQKGAIVGICQNGGLFWDKVTDEVIHRVIAIEPMLESLTLGSHLSTAEWVVAGSETGEGRLLPR